MLLTPQLPIGQSGEGPPLQPIGRFRAAQIRFVGEAAIEVARLLRCSRRAGCELWDFGSISRRHARADSDQ